MNHSDWIRWLGQLFIQDDAELMKYPGIRYPDWFGVQAQKSRLTRYTTGDQHIILVPGAKMPSQIPTCLPTPHFLWSDRVCYIMPLGSFGFFKTSRSYYLKHSKTMVINLFKCRWRLYLTARNVCLWRRFGTTETPTVAREKRWGNNFFTGLPLLAQPPRKQAVVFFSFEHGCVWFFGHDGNDLLGSGRCLWFLLVHGKQFLKFQHWFAPLENLEPVEPRFSGWWSPWIAYPNGCLIGLELFF